MSTYEELYEDAKRDEWYEHLYAEHSEQALHEFRVDRLASYYAAHLDVAAIPYTVLADARQLREISTPAALIRATTASELGIKCLLLRPIVHGLVHSESLAGAVTDLVMSHQQVDRYRNLLFGILNEYGGVDLASFSRLRASQPLWMELRHLQAIRNRVVHKGEVPSAAQADAAIAVAETVLELLFPQVTARLGFHLHGATLCDDIHLSEDIAKLIEDADSGRNGSATGPIG